MAKKRKVAKKKPAKKKKAAKKKKPAKKKPVKKKKPAKKAKKKVAKKKLVKKKTRKVRRGLPKKPVEAPVPEPISTLFPATPMESLWSDEEETGPADETGHPYSGEFEE